MRFSLRPSKSSLATCRGTSCNGARIPKGDLVMEVVVQLHSSRSIPVQGEVTLYCGSCTRLEIAKMKAFILGCEQVATTPPPDLSKFELIIGDL